MKTLSTSAENRQRRTEMYNWTTQLLVVLLIVFSGFNLIRSDCGADGGFCINRRTDTVNTDKGLWFFPRAHFCYPTSSGSRFCSKFHEIWIFFVRISIVSRGVKILPDVRAARIDYTNQADARLIQRQIDQARFRAKVRDANAERRRVDATRTGLYGFVERVSLFSGCFFHECPIRLHPHSRRYWRDTLSPRFEITRTFSDRFQQTRYFLALCPFSMIIGEATRIIRAGLFSDLLERRISRDSREEEFIERRRGEWPHWAIICAAHL